MAVTNVPLAHLPADLRVCAALFKDVRNSKYLRDQLVAGNTDFEYAFVDARMVLSTTHVLAAVFRAVNDVTQQRLKTRNVHAEVVFALNPNNNIAEAFRKFGVTEGTKDLLVIKIGLDLDPEDVAQHLQRSVEGLPITFSDENIAALSDLQGIRKVYNLDTPSRKGKNIPQTSHQSSQEPGTDGQDMEMDVLGMLALRGAT